ncbi:MAG: hypothetical protein ABIS17_03205 [Casimicrobiaceae bacterium]
MDANKGMIPLVRASALMNSGSQANKSGRRLSRILHSAVRERAFGTRTPTGPKPVNTSRRSCQPLPTTACRSWPSRRSANCVKLLKLGLQRLGNRPLSSFPQYRTQQILPLWLTQWNYRILFHGGVAPCRSPKSDFDTRIPAGHAAFLNSSSYTRFGYSSCNFAYLVPYPIAGASTDHHLLIAGLVVATMIVPACAYRDSL